MKKERTWIKIINYSFTLSFLCRSLYSLISLFNFADVAYDKKFFRNQMLLEISYLIFDIPSIFAVFVLHFGKLKKQNRPILKEPEVNL
jgi:hypothetical protein